MAGGCGCCVADGGVADPLGADVLKGVESVFEATRVAGPIAPLGTPLKGVARRSACGDPRSREEPQSSDNFGVPHCEGKERYVDVTYPGHARKLQLRGMAMSAMSLRLAKIA